MTSTSKQFQISYFKMSSPAIFSGFVPWCLWHLTISVHSWVSNSFPCVCPDVGLICYDYQRMHSYNSLSMWISMALFTLRDFYFTCFVLADTRAGWGETGPSGPCTFAARGYCMAFNNNLDPSSMLS